MTMEGSVALSEVLGRCLCKLTDLSRSRGRKMDQFPNAPCQFLITDCHPLVAIRQSRIPRVGRSAPKRCGRSQVAGALVRPVDIVRRVRDRMIGQSHAYWQGDTSTQPAAELGRALPLI